MQQMCPVKRAVAAHDDKPVDSEPADGLGSPSSPIGAQEALAARRLENGPAQVDDPGDRPPGERHSQPVDEPLETFEDAPDFHAAPGRGPDHGPDGGVDSGAVPG